MNYILRSYCCIQTAADNFRPNGSSPLSRPALSVLYGWMEMEGRKIMIFKVSKPLGVLERT